MAEPLTWRAILAIAQILSGIRVVDGYYTDLGAGRIVTSRAQQADDNTPFAVVLAQTISTNEESTGRSRTTLRGDMDFIIEYAVPFNYGDNPERLAHRARADIVRALGVPMRELPLGINNLVVTSSLIDAAPQPGTNLIVAQISARATLSESLSPA